MGKLESFVNQDGSVSVGQNSPNVPGMEPCNTDASLYSEYQLISLGITILLIILLCILEKRSDREKCKCSRNRPGLIYPVNLLDYNGDNIGYAAAFGSMASHCWNLFWNSTSIYAQAPTWSKTLIIMASVIYIGLLYYPFFVCLSTKWVFIGSIFGLGYSSWWFYLYMNTIILCPDGIDHGLQGYNLAVLLPVVICLFVLVLKFGFTLIKHTVNVIQRRRRSAMHTRLEKKIYTRVSTDHNVTYVKQLIQPGCTRPVTEYTTVPTQTIRTRFKLCLSFWIYRNDPTFKYSPSVICLFTVALICSYQFGILLILGVNAFKKSIPDFISVLKDNATTGADADTIFQIKLGLDVFEYSVVISFILASCITLFAITRILANYRMDLRKMYKGDFTRLPFKRTNRHPQLILSDALSYAGSQIAYFLWGYVVLFAVLLLTCFLLAYIIILPIFNLISREILQVMGNLLAGVVIMQVFMVLQKVFARFFLQRRSSVDDKGRETTVPILALDNRKVYHNVSYFLFLFYIVLGVFGCLFTILKGVCLGVFFLARLDKCGLIQEFQTWDRGYMYYVSFLHIEESHRHPVMLVFCDILMNIDEKDDIRLHQYGGNHSRNQSVSSNNGTFLEQSESGLTRRQTSVLSYQQRLARNRWFKAYTLIRNHSLIKSEFDKEFDMLSDVDRLVIA